MKCLGCGKEFEPHHGLQKYCTLTCQDKNMHHRYYVKYREEILAKKRARYAEHREEILQQNKKSRWRKAGEKL